MTTHECLWYNGNGQYELLEFDPDGLSKLELRETIINELRRLGVGNSDIGKASETVYLLKVDHLKRIFKHRLDAPYHVGIK